MKAKDWENIATFLGMVVLVPTMILTDLWAITKLWAWYISPAFGIHSLTKHEAFGFWLLYIVVRFDPSRPKVEKPIVSLVAGICVTFTVVFIGWIAR